MLDFISNKVKHALRGFNLINRMRILISERCDLGRIEINERSGFQKAYEPIRGAQVCHGMTFRFC